MSSTRQNVEWLPKPNNVALIFTDQPPKDSLIGAVFAYIFNEKCELLLVEKTGKGTFDIPGGGREGHESWQETVKREILEEAFVEIENLEIVALQKLTIEVEGEKPHRYTRPFPVAYEVFVKAKLKGTGPFIKNDETIARNFFSIEQALLQEGILFENRADILKACM
tara:strand:- start:48023 stop:48523 length:501 start_codon:yes stop_codon:yes gene_type:complete